MIHAHLVDAGEKEVYYHIISYHKTSYGTIPYHNENIRRRPAHTQQGITQAMHNRLSTHDSSLPPGLPMTAQAKTLPAHDNTTKEPIDQAEAPTAQRNV